MDLLAQCQLWHKQQQYLKIIQTIETLPVDERTPALDCELAYAYNSMAFQAEDIAWHHRALELLKPHEELFKEQYDWQYHMGFAYLWLELHDLAIQHFEKALDIKPEDSDTMLLMSECESALTFPSFERPFRQRVKEAWEAFLGKEAFFRQGLDARVSNERQYQAIIKASEKGLDDNGMQHTIALMKENEMIEAQLQTTLQAILKVAFHTTACELLKEADTYVLRLPINGSKLLLFLLVYFRRCMPLALRSQWRVELGLPSMRPIRYEREDLYLEGDDVRISLVHEEGGWQLHCYCEKLVAQLEDHQSEVWYILIQMIAQAIGELPTLACLDEVLVMDVPLEKDMGTLNELEQIMLAEDLPLTIEAERYLDESKATYHFEDRLTREELAASPWRSDIMVSHTRAPGLLGEYHRGSEHAVNMLHHEGVVAGYLLYPLADFSEVDNPEAAADAFCQALEQTLEEKAGAESIYLLGEGRGRYYGYVDFLAWDLIAVLDVADTFFNDSEVSFGYFRTFRTHAGNIYLKRKERDETYVV